MHFEHSAEVEALSLAVRWADLCNLLLPLIGCGAGLANLSQAPFAETTAAVPAMARPVVNWVIEVPCYKPSHVEVS